MLDYYGLRKTWARTWLIKPEDMDGRQGARDRSLYGVFDVDGWCEVVGITRAEYDTIERALRHHRRKLPRKMGIRLVDKVLTGLGRPDLFQINYGDPAVHEQVQGGGHHR